MAKALNLILKMIDVDEKKRKIIAVMKEKGPVLPVQISREVGLNTLFSSAILSEMVSSKAIKISNLKIGGSPLYYLISQEQLLENFSKHLGSKGKETFELIKKEGVLRDESVSPADRVSLREIKDFAFPVKFNTEDGEKLFWRFHSINHEEALKKIEEIYKKRKKDKKTERIEKKQEIKKEKIEILEKKQDIETKEESLTQKIDSEFFDKVNSYLRENDITIIQTSMKKKKDALMIVLVPSAIGKIEMLLICKDKKTVNEADLSVAASQSSSNKLPALFLTSGKLAKNSGTILENFKNHVFFRQL